MLYGASNNGDSGQDFFGCSLYHKDKEMCNGYFIWGKVLETYGSETNLDCDWLRSVA